MKMLIRIFMTWLLGMALVFAIIDGAKSFSASELQMTSCATLWQGLHGPTYMASRAWLDMQLDKFNAAPLSDVLFGLPAWSVFLVFGLLLVPFARRPRSPAFIRTR